MDLTVTSRQPAIGVARHRLPADGLKKVRKWLKFPLSELRPERPVFAFARGASQPRRQRCAHPAPLMWRRKSGVASPDGAQALPLGLFGA